MPWFSIKRKLETFNSVLDRLLHEAVISLEVAEEVKEFANMIPTIHADVNPNEQNLSNRVADAIIDMIKGMGYQFLLSQMPGQQTSPICIRGDIEYKK